MTTTFMRLSTWFVKRAWRCGAVLTALVFVCTWPTASLHAQGPARPTVRLPDESAGIAAIARTLLGAFDQVDVVVLGEVHEGPTDAALRLALIRSPEFAQRVHAIVIECGSMAEQATLDAYMRGESVSASRLARVWKTTRNGEGFCTAPIYAEFLAAVRAVNARLPAASRIRVLGGEPGASTARGPVDVLREQVFAQHAKALVIYGSAHVYLTGPPDYLESIGGASLVATLNTAFPGRTLGVIPIGAFARPGAITSDAAPDFRKFDQAIASPTRPVLLSLQRAPFRDLSAAEFLGRTLTTCRGSAGCRSVFAGSALTLGQMADAVVYLGH